jgi:hypothetical protein
MLVYNKYTCIINIYSHDILLKVRKSVAGIATGNGVDRIPVNARLQICPGARLASCTIGGVSLSRG